MYKAELTQAQDEIDAEKVLLIETMDTSALSNLKVRLWRRPTRTFKFDRALV